MAVPNYTLSINETAKALSLGRSSIYNLINSKKLHTVKIGKRTLITTESIQRLIKEARDVQE